MSVCDECIKPKAVARCVTNLIIGTIANVSTSVFVYIADLSTGRDIRYTVTSSITGLVTVPITPQRFSEDHSYQIHITLATAPNIESKIPITVGIEVGNCIALRFETIWANDNTIATYTDQTLKL